MGEDPQKREVREQFKNTQPRVIAESTEPTDPFWILQKQANGYWMLSFDPDSPNASFLKFEAKPTSVSLYTTDKKLYRLAVTTEDGALCVVDIDRTNPEMAMEKMFPKENIPSFVPTHLRWTEDGNLIFAGITPPSETPIIGFIEFSPFEPLPHKDFKAAFCAQILPHQTEITDLSYKYNPGSNAFEIFTQPQSTTPSAIIYASSTLQNPGKKPYIEPHSTTPFPFQIQPNSQTPNPHQQTP